MDNRKFGVEIECGHASGYSHVRQLLQDKGYNVGNGYDSGSGYWTVGCDGSGVEVRTPPLQGEEGFKILKDTMNLLKSEGCFVARCDGTHVHHDAPEFRGRMGLKNKTRLINSWKANEELIEKWVDPYRRDLGSCPKLKGGRFGHTVYRGAMNVSALAEHGTVEIRLHEGTLDPDEIIAWIKFGQHLLDSVAKRKNPIPCAKNNTDLLKKIKMSQAAKRGMKQKRKSKYPTALHSRRTSASGPPW